MEENQPKQESFPEVGNDSIKMNPIDRIIMTDKGATIMKGGVQ